METRKSDAQRREKSACPNMPVNDEIKFLDLLLVLVNHKKMILVTCVVTFVLACGAMLLMPNIYTATAKILPPQEDKGGLGAMLGGMGDLASLAGVSVGGGSGDLYVSMLQSRTVADAIIDRFDLKTRFEWETRSGAYNALAAKLNVALEMKDGIIEVSVDDKDPHLAADMANAFVEELQKLNVAINLNSAGRQRKFLEDRLTMVKKDLIKAEEGLKGFQETNKAFRIADQAKAIIEAISKLKGALAGKEVELGVLLSYQTEQHPQVKGLKEGIAQIKDQLRKLERSPPGKKVSGDTFIATSAVPELGVQYGRLLREFKVQETLFELLTKQYEVAKIDEAKNTSTIQVLDPAFVPDRKSKPKRSFVVLLLTVVAAFMAVFFAFIREYRVRMLEEDRVRWLEIKKSLQIRKKSGTND